MKSFLLIVSNLSFLACITAGLPEGRWFLIPGFIGMAGFWLIALADLCDDWSKGWPR